MAESASSRPPLALIANDHEWSIRSLESILAPHGYGILRAFTGKQAFELACDTAPDLIILDAQFSDIPGTEVCRSLIDDPRTNPWSPIFITSAGRWTRQARLEALAAGAWDYLALPLDAEEFLLRLDVYLRPKAESDRVREEGLVDSVTGLYNLRGLMRRAREFGADAARHGRALACVAFAPDLPNGEPGTNGYGDRELWSAVDRMAGVFGSVGRASDAIGRVRLCEFVVIAPGTDMFGAEKLARRFVAAVEASVDRAESTPLALLAGYDAVHDLREAGIQPAALLAGATTALRQSQAETGGDRIRQSNGGKRSPPTTAPPTLS